MTSQPTQRSPRLRLSTDSRLAVAAAYLAALTLLARWAHSGWPPGDSRGLWFYTAAVAVLLSVFLSEPYYTSPKAALGSSGALFLFALTADTNGLQASTDAVSRGRAVLLAFSAAVFLVSATALLTRERFPRVNSIVFPLAVTFGAGSFLFAVAFVFSVYATFADQPERLALLLATGLLFTWGPFERIANVLRNARLRRPAARAIVVDQVHDPSTAIVTAPTRALAIGDELQAPDGTLGAVVDITNTAASQSARVAFSPGVVLRPGAVLKRPSAEPAGDDAVIGYIAPGSAMNAVRVAAPSSVTALQVEEGRLIAADIRGNEVLFQITGASIERETLGDESHERFRIDAQKLGYWDPAKRAFELVPWLPDPGTAVRLKTREEASFDPEGIGFVPGSRFAIRYEPKRAVTHNTAVLGILGSGKTTLAQELICRNIAGGVKVLVLDITDEYAPHFDTLVPDAEAADRVQAINAALIPSQTINAATADGYGSRMEFLRQIKSDIADFIAGDDPIRIYDPNRFKVTTNAGGKDFKTGTAELRELTLVEKTSLIAGALLLVTQALGASDHGRVCLVIEEAHSLTPEPHDGGLGAPDTRAVQATVRAVLQGRKYGYGCLLVTQRTANVSKTILNQCHTVFALRSYDATGIAFLTNYLGEQYSRLLSSMPMHYCVGFGEGISCTAPVVMQLNHPEEFESSYWAPRVAGLKPERLCEPVLPDLAGALTADGNGSPLTGPVTEPESSPGDNEL